MSRTFTRGNVIVEDIKIGDIHYEYEYGQCRKSIVETQPTKNKDGNWVWCSRELSTARLIDYLVNPNYPQYSVNLYDYEAYKTK